MARITHSLPNTRSHSSSVLENGFEGIANLAHMACMLFRTVLQPGRSRMYDQTRRSNPPLNALRNGRLMTPTTGRSFLLLPRRHQHRAAIMTGYLDLPQSAMERSNTRAEPDDAYVKTVKRTAELARLKSRAHERNNLLVFGPEAVGKTRLLVPPD